MAKTSKSLRKNTSSSKNSDKAISKGKRKRKAVSKDSPPQQRSSIYRGVTRHRWTGRYEAHLWDKNCWNDTQTKKGRQGAYNDEDAAGHAYDLAALKYWGQHTILNFPLILNEEELYFKPYIIFFFFVCFISSILCVTVFCITHICRHHHNGRWEARIGRVFGNKYLYLGTYASEEEAAMAYDMAAIEYRGQNAVTNFDLSRYLNTIPNTNQILEKTSAVDPPETPPESEKPRRSFPDYIQTYFEVCQDSSSFVDDEHDIIFGELDSFVLPMFQCELEYCPNIEAR
ncbi:AP2-like ethylene-responsive transcription factor [Capsicum annuum]|uniref:AP2-like ethylene-responsive transcription factor n=1 Tax=Capsicum annuum TaxID=4072 RepID=A0A2G2ZC69_CAPAN|nr:AP2-like ethylene-responsive transcription factor [Capsicum annuum]